MVIRCFNPHLDVITLKLPDLAFLKFWTEQEFKCLFLSVSIRSVIVKQVLFFKKKKIKLRPYFKKVSDFKDNFQNWLNLK